MPAAHRVQSGAGWPPGLNDPALHKPHSEAALAPGLGLCVPAGQGVESPERAGQKQPRAQGMGREDDGGQKKPGGQGSQPPVALMKKPERQPERRISTVL